MRGSGVRVPSAPPNTSRGRFRSRQLGPRAGRDDRLRAALAMRGRRRLRGPDQAPRTLTPSGTCLEIARTLPNWSSPGALGVCLPLVTPGTAGASRSRALSPRMELPGNAATPRTNAGGLSASGENRPRTSPVAWGAGACELSIRWLGGCHLMLTQVYTSGTSVCGNREKAGDFTKRVVTDPFSRSFHAQIGVSGGRPGSVPVVTHDTRGLSRLPNLPRHPPNFSRSSGTRHHTGRSLT